MTQGGISWLTKLTVITLLNVASMVAINVHAQAASRDKLVNVEATVVGQMKTRHYLVTIYAAPNGPLYTVIDADGNIQGAQLPPHLLAQRFPVLKSMLDNPAEYAGNGSMSLETNTGQNGIFPSDLSNSP